MIPIVEVVGEEVEQMLGNRGLGDDNARLLDTPDTAKTCELSELRQTTTTAVEILRIDQGKQAPDRSHTSSTVL